MEQLLRVEGLSKRFPQVVANDDLSLDVRRGEIHCLLGENGAGKTTLAECLYGFFKPDAGRIFFRGQPVRLSSPSDAIALGIGMVHQHFVLVPPLTVVENVVAGTPSAGVLLDLAGAKRDLETLCRKYGVDLDLEARVWQLSVGKQQWVEILKALYVGSELLILDEPTAVLTPQETDRFFATLRQMTREGLSILLITHKLNEVMRVSDRVTVLRKGRLVATVQTAEVTPADLARMMVGREVVFRIEREAIHRGEAVLNLHRREILGVAGIAGNGQKELFEVLAGIRRAGQGQVRLQGARILNRSPGEIM